MAAGKMNYTMRLEPRQTVLLPTCRNLRLGASENSPRSSLDLIATQVSHQR